jgi:hypothetical protein
MKIQGREDMMIKAAKPQSVDDYLAALPDDDYKQAALARLRRLIKAAAPKATGVISYGSLHTNTTGCSSALRRFRTIAAFSS